MSEPTHCPTCNTEGDCIHLVSAYWQDCHDAADSDEARAYYRQCAADDGVTLEVR